MSALILSISLRAVDPGRIVLGFYDYYANLLHFVAGRQRGGGPGQTGRQVRLCQERVIPQRFHGTRAGTVVVSARSRTRGSQRAPKILYTRNTTFLLEINAMRTFRFVHNDTDYVRRGMGLMLFSTVRGKAYTAVCFQFQSYERWCC